MKCALCKSGEAEYVYYTIDAYEIYCLDCIIAHSGYDADKLGWGNDLKALSNQYPKASPEQFVEVCFWRYLDETTNEPENALVA